MFWFTINQKHRRLLVQVAFEGLPCSNILTDNEFVIASKVAGDTKSCGRVEVLAEVL